jgi:hypothetical protein
MSAPSLVSFGWEAGRSKQVFYVANDGQVHELYKIAGSSWSHAPTSSLVHSSARVGDYQLFGFAWEANHSKHVFFESHQGPVHELSVQTDWQDDNLGLMFPGMGQVAAGYVWEPVTWATASSKHLIHTTINGREISELSFKIGTSWQTRNLSHAARLHTQVRYLQPPLDSPGGVSITGYGWAGGNSQHVAFIGDDGHIHELFTENAEVWMHNDLTEKAGAPPPSTRFEKSFITGYAWEEGHSKQILYFDDSGAIHELYCNSGSDWHWVNLTERTRAPRVSASRYHRMVGYGWAGRSTKQVVFIGDDRHIYEMYCGKLSDWAGVADLTSIARNANDWSMVGAPPARRDYDVIAACGWGWGESKHVVYVSADSHIIELSVGLDGVWQFLDLTSSTSSSPSI